MSYYLADGILPRWPVFVKTIGYPTDPKKIYFAQRQEAVRKDVEQTFGVLQSRWATVKGPTRLLYSDCIADLMYTCIIMHNMIVENERADVTDWANEDGVGPSHIVATASVRMVISRGDAKMVQAYADVRHQESHIRFQYYIIEELWARKIAC